MPTNRQLCVAGFVLLAIGALAVLSAFGLFPVKAKAELDSSRCTISSQTAVAIGHQLATTIAAEAPNRAFVKIQQVTLTNGIATSTVYLGLGQAATVGNGLKLSTTTPELEFGKSTFFPYTGAITALTDTASTSVLVTICNY